MGTVDSLVVTGYHGFPYDQLVLQVLWTPMWPGVPQVPWTPIWSGGSAGTMDFFVVMGLLGYHGLTCGQAVGYASTLDSLLDNKHL